MDASPSGVTRCCAEGGGVSGSTLRSRMQRRGFDARRRARAPRQVDDENGPLSRLDVHAKGALMRTQDLHARVEAEAQSPEVSGRDRALEALEDPRLILRRDTDAVITYGDANGISS